MGYDLYPMLMTYILCFRVVAQRSVAAAAAALVIHIDDKKRRGYVRKLTLPTYTCGTSNEQKAGLSLGMHRRYGGEITHPACETVAASSTQGSDLRRISSQQQQQL